MTRLTLALVSIALGCATPELPEPTERLSVAELLGPADTTGFERALEPRAFNFPADHGPHPGFRTEWWYYTGNLSDTDGGRFGYQLTFFQTVLAATPADRESLWATREIYMAHLTVTDAGARTFRSAERFARGALGLAGARTEPFEVWLEDWSVSQESSGRMRLRAAEGDIELDLGLTAGKPPVLQGDDGLSRKGSLPGNASYYYSLTRMPTQGFLRVGTRRFDVSGSSWMDREWSTSVLEPDQVGWDWFALQLDDGRELMAYQLRRDDGSADEFSSGALVDSSGGKRFLASDDFAIRVLDTWTSPESAVEYPSDWSLSVAEEGIDLRVRPILADQELRQTFRYWEGAVEVTGTAGGEAISGRGYVELTGYD